MNSYINNELLELKVTEPLILAESTKKFDIKVFPKNKSID